MNIAVCVKQIPDPAAPQSFDSSNNLNRSGKLILDEADTYGVEMALQLVDKAGGGEVTVVSMGSAERRRGTAQRAGHGRHEGGHRERRLASRQRRPLAPPRCWPPSLKRESFDLVLAATESSDGYTGTTPVQLAELLGLPSITFAKAVARRRRGA